MILLIALGFAALWFALTLVFWPLAALIRRHYQRKLALSPAERRLRLWVKLGCAVDLTALLAFAGVMAYGFSNLFVFSDRTDPWLRVVQFVFLLGVAATCGMLYSSYRLWRTAAKGWWISAYTVGLFLASFIYLWFTAASRVLQVSLKY